MKDKKTYFNSESISKLIAIIGPLLFGSIYLYCLGYTESLGVTEFPSISQALSFYINSIVYKLNDSLNTLWFFVCLLIGLFLNFGFEKYFFSKKEVQLPLERREFFEIKSTEIFSSSLDIENKLNQKRDLLGLRDEELRLYKRYLKIRRFIIFFSSPISIYISIIIFYELSVFVPVSISLALFYVVRSIEDFHWKKMGLDYFAMFMCLTMAVGTWVLPYTSGRKTAIYNLTNNPEKFPSQYLGDSDFGYLLWMGDKARYFIFCNGNQPGVYEVYGKEKVFIFNGDAIFQTSFCK